MRLNQGFSKDHLSALIANSVQSLVAVTRGKRGLRGNVPRKGFDSVHFILA